jgi:hypothetical protein
MFFLNLLLAFLSVVGTVRVKGVETFFFIYLLCWIGRSVGIARLRTKGHGVCFCGVGLEPSPLLLRQFINPF